MTEYLDCYIRVSTTEQTKGFSLDTQTEIGQKISGEKGLKFRVRDEGGRSSTIGFRPVLEELKDDIERGLVKHLWIYDRSRLFRDETDSSLFRKDYLDKFKVQFYEGERGNLVNFDSLEEKLSYDIISKLQQYENEKRSHKSKQGKRHLLRQGLDNRWYGGSVLFGYKSEDGTLSIDEEQSKWVIWMFNAVLDGVSSIDIKGELDRNGVVPPRTKSGLWNLGTINKILGNRSYIGERTFYDKELEETFSYSITPIISRSTFLRVRNEVERRQKLQDNNKKHFTLFGDYMECECGQSVGSEIKKGTRKDGMKYDTRVYYCQSKNRKWKEGKKSNCRNVRSMNIPKTDQYLLEHIQSVVSNSHLLKERFKNDVLSSKFDKDKDLTKQETKLEEKCKSLIRRQEQTYENIILMETDLVQGRREKKITQGILKRLRTELDSLKDEVVKTELEIENLSSERVWLDWMSKYGEDLKYKMTDKENKSSWIKGLIDRIVVNVKDGQDRDGNVKQVGHRFDVFFKMKVVKDKLTYIDPDNKGSGYNVTEGRRKSSSDVVNLTKGRGKKKDTDDTNTFNHGSETLHHGGMIPKTAEQSLEQKFAKATGFYEKGKFDKANKIFRRIQRANPGIPEVLHMLGLIALKTDRAEDAVGHLESAVQSAPGSADLFGLLGGALEKAGRTGDAAKAFEQAITLEPGLAETHYNLGNALRDLGRSQDAVVSYRRAVELYPGFADALNNLGLVLADMGSYDDAVSSFLGACAITPGDAWIYSNLGNAYRNMGKAEDAIDTHRRAVELDPEGVEYRSNLAAALVEIGFTEDGADEFRRALEAAPGDPGLLCGFGNALVDQGRIEDAKAAFAQALEAEPDNPMAHYLLGRALLLDGDFGRGWQEFAWRFKVASLGLRDPDLLPQPPWQGEKVVGKTILVWGEQGVGDEVLFAGQIPDLLAQGANVVMECDPRLIPLFERSLDGVRGIAKTDPPAEETRSPDIDFQVPSGNLGRWLRPGLDNFPAHGGYLRPDERRRQALRQRYLDGDDVLLVGIAWSSNNVKLGRHKSMPLSAMQPLTKIPGLRFVDLQYGDTGPERQAFEAANGSPLIHDHDIDQMADLDAFAAQVAALDLVISVSNTTVHIAGAMAVPTWVLLNAAPLSCWMRDGDASPWYPSVRLIRQTQAGEWTDVIERVAKELSGFAKV